MIHKQLLRKKMADHPPFFQKVWTECQKIPKGETRTYGWIAQKIGHPKAARAVGSALAKNPFAPQIPCHRVIRSDGKIGNYSAPGGSLRKKRMLEQEASIRKQTPFRTNLKIRNP